MIEDALKSLRNIHRLIITVSFITLVFSMSIDAPKDIEKQRDLISELLLIDFLEYLEFVDQNVNQFESEQLTILSTQINDSLALDDYMIFNLEDIGNAFSQTVHVGRVLAEDIVTSNISDATLNQLDALNGISLDADVQVILPKTDELIEEVRSFLVYNGELGQRVDNVLLSIIDYTWIAESFLPDSTVLVNLYFELPETIRTMGAPVFNADFDAKIVEIPGTSFRSWILAKDRKELFDLRNDELVWLPKLDISSPGYKEQKLGLLEKELTDRITKSAPEQQKVSLLGTSIPGVLFVYASPLILLGLIYYLLNHSYHIRSLVPGNEDEIRNFSWSPMTQRKIWKFDLISSVFVLPMLAMVVLYIQLSQFGPISIIPSLVLWLCFTGVLLLGRSIYRNIALIRNELVVNLTPAKPS